MRIEDLAELLGKTKEELEEMLKSTDIIELNLSERKPKQREEADNLRICE